MLPFKQIIKIEHKSALPVYIKISNSIIENISTGVLAPDTRLPSTRVLAQMLEVHRKTVVAAYDELAAQGWITSKGTAGTFISKDLPLIQIKKNKNPVLPNKTTEKPSFDFIIDDGHPDIRLAPIESFRRAYSSLFRNNSFIKQLGYNDNFKGNPGFRKELAKHLRNTRGVYVGEDNILISRGSIHAIYLIIASLLKDKKTIAAEHPGYGTFEEIVKLHNANFLKIPVDDKGISVDYIEQICKKQRLDMVFVIPHHHYPTTVTLSADRRIKLVELAKQYDFLIVEDDYDYDFQYSSGPVLPLSSLDHEGHVLYIGSFSKTVVPAIRLGFIVGDENLIEQLARYRRYVDRNSDLILEKVMQEMLRFGELSRHNKKAIKIYRERRDIMHVAFQKHFKKLFDYKLPDGGMAFWITFKKEVDHDLIRQRISEKSIRFDWYGKEGFRVGFAAINEQEIEARIELLKYLFAGYY